MRFDEYRVRPFNGTSFGLSLFLCAAVNGLSLFARSITYFNPSIDDATLSVGFPFIGFKAGGFAGYTQWFVPNLVLNGLLSIVISVYFAFKVDITLDAILSTDSGPWLKFRLRDIAIQVFAAAVAFSMATWLAGTRHIVRVLFLSCVVAPLLTWLCNKEANGRLTSSGAVYLMLLLEFAILFCFAIGHATYAVIAVSMWFSSTGLLLTAELFRVFSFHPKQTVNSDGPPPAEDAPRP